jgi:hypothetical protein
MDYPDAIDAMFSEVKTGLDAGWPAIVGTMPELRWQGRETTPPPDGGVYWARVSQQTVLERQQTLGKLGERKFESCGLIFVQIFCPRSSVESFEKGRQLAQVARNVFRGQNSGVWFRNARINELDPEQGFWRFNVVSEYEFTEQA